MARLETADRMNKYLKRHHMTYSEYLQTWHWQDLKKRFRASKYSKGKCYICGSVNEINIHHKTYKRIGKERLADLVELCRDHHHMAHTLLKEKPNLHLFFIHRTLKKTM